MQNRKGHLAAALGVKGVENGFSVTWLTADELLKRLWRDEQEPGKRNRRRTYLSSSVLIIDELGFQDLDRPAKRAQIEPPARSLRSTGAL